MQQTTTSYKSSSSCMLKSHHNKEIMHNSRSAQLPQPLVIKWLWTMNLTAFQQKQNNRNSDRVKHQNQHFCYTACSLTEHT